MHELAAEFLTYGTQEKNYSPATVKSYRTALNTFARHLDTLRVPAEDVSPSQIAAYDDAHSESWRPRTRRLHLCAIKAFYKWLHAEKGLIVRDPAKKVKMPEMDRSSRSCPRGQVRIRIIEACDRLPDEKRGVLAKAVLGVMINAGLRPAEACALKLSDVVLTEDPYLIVRKGKGSKRREDPINADLADWLRGWLKLRGVCKTDFFFVRNQRWPLSLYVLRTLLKDVKAVAGIKDNGLTPHSLRHSFATTLYEAGVDMMTIKDLLGHQALSTTVGYVHPGKERLTHAVSRLNKSDTGTLKKVKPVQLMKARKK